MAISDTSQLSSNKKMAGVFFISFFLMILPMLVLEFIILKGNIGISGWPGFDITHGIVFTATLGVITRIFIRTGIQVGIRTGIRSAIRTAIRSIMRGQVRSVIKSRSPVTSINQQDSWFKRWIFIQHSENRSQGIIGELLRLVMSLAILSLSFLIVAMIKAPKDPFNPKYNPEINKLLTDLLALTLVFVFLYVVEKTIAEIILNRDFSLFLTIDGIIVQILFTLGLSFLPLVHDSEMNTQEKKPRALMGIFGISSLIMLAIISHVVFLEFLPDDTFFRSLANFAILFALLFSFPSQPYEGGDIFSWNKFLALVLFFSSFVLSIFILSDDLVFLI